MHSLLLTVMQPIRHCCFSFQARFDYWFSTLPLNQTRPHDGPIQACLYGIALKCSHGGLGIRPMSGRTSILNGLNCSLPQTLDLIGDNGKVTPGLWDSLSTIIGAGSFDTANKATCWGAFHMSGSVFASDQVKETGTLRTRYTSTLERLGEEPFPDSILSAPTIGFGYGKQKLHKTLMGVLRGNEARLLNPRAEAMPRDDPRAEA